MIIFAILATISLGIAALVATLLVGAICVVTVVFRLEDRPGSPHDFLPRMWSRIVLFATGVRVKVHNRELLADGKPHIFVANHVSWFDIPALACFLPRAKFVAKAELFNLPVFGPAMRVVGMIPIERQNRKAAFGSYDDAAKKIREGNSVVVFPEATRGASYPLRPFKKGPFVLAIAAGAPIVPVLIHGTLEVISKGDVLVHPGRVDVHLLEPIEVEGLDYNDRDALAEKVRQRINDALASIYGIEGTQATAGEAMANQTTNND
ncbi:MAG: lysophospholipid acyltransferase family protein [Gemmatimonadales bacterium]